MRKLIVVAGLMLLWTQAVRAQCTGQYANDPTYAMLIPKDYAAQGNVAVTLTFTATDGSNVFHKGTVGTGTHLLVNWKGWNLASPPTIVYKFDYQTTWTNFWYQPTADNGTYDGITPGSNWAGHVMLFRLLGSGSNATTQDIVNLTVTNQSPGIYFNDGLDTNFYWQVVTTGGGNSMLTSCQECQAGTTQHCINAVHTPYSTIQLTNDMSGESQLIQGVQAGNAARSNESVSFSASLAISVLPGDTGTISIDDKIICSADGVIFEQTLPKPKTSPSGGSWNPSVTGELAFTKVALKVPTHCTPLLDSNGNVIGLHCDVAYYCTARSSPPDYQPTGLDTYHYTNPALVPPFWMSMAPGTALVFGRNQPGEIAIWYFPFATVHGVLTGMGGTDPLLLDILSPAWASDNSAQDCTKWISGISPWYMPKW